MIDLAGKGAFFIAGGTVPPGSPSYVERSADRELYEALTSGEYCYVLNSRQMGKSSLAVRTVARLNEFGVRTAFVDLTRIGGPNVTAEQWFAGLVAETGRVLGLRGEAVAFLRVQKELGPAQRFLSFLHEIALPAEDSRLVVLIDEIDAVRSLSFSTDELFAGIRQLHNGRASESDLSRLNFCLLGAALPSDLIRDPRTTPFNVGRRIELRDFTVEEAKPFAQALGPNGRDRLQRVLYWTGGHPFLTQAICAELATDKEMGVDMLVKARYMDDRAKDTDTNLTDVGNRLLGRGDPTVRDRERADTLSLYAKTLKGGIVDDESNPSTARIKLSGVVRLANGKLAIRNRIYAEVFGKVWIRDNMPGQELRRQKKAFLKGVIRTAVVSASIVGAIGLLAWNSYRLQRVAESERTKAERARNQAEYQAYLSTVNFMRSAYEAGDFGKLDSLVKATENSPYRNFEWNYWRRRLSQDHGKPVGNQRDFAYVAPSSDGKFISVQDYATHDVEILSYPQLKLLRRVHNVPSSQGIDYVKGRWILIDQASDQHIAILDLNRKLLDDIRFDRQTIQGALSSNNGAFLLWTLVGDDGGYEAAEYDFSRLRFASRFRLPLRYDFGIPSGDGSTIALISAASRPQDAFIDVYRAKSGKLLERIGGLQMIFQDNAIPFSFDGSGRYLVYGQSNGVLTVRDLTTQRNVLVTKVSDLPILGAILAIDGRRVFEYSTDSVGQILAVPSGKTILRKTGVRFAWPDDAEDTIGAGGQGATIISADSHREQSYDAPGSLAIQALPTDRFFIEGRKGWSFLDLSAGKFYAEKRGSKLFEGSALSRGLGTAHDHVFVKTANRWLDFSITAGTMATRDFKQGTAPIQALSDGDYLLFSFSSKEIERVTASGKRLWSIGLQEFLVSSAVASDDRFAVIGEGWSGRIEIVDLIRGTVVKSLPGESMLNYAVAVSPDGRIGASGDDSGVITFFGTSAKDSWVKRLTGHSAKVTSASFSPDSKRLLTSSYDGTARLWDTSTGEEMLRIEGRSPLSGATFNSAATKILTLDIKGKIRVYDGNLVPSSAEK